MEGENSGRKNSNAQLLEELETLSQSLYQSHTSRARRTTSLALPRTSVPSVSSNDDVFTAKVEQKPSNNRSRRRMSLSPWRSRPKLDEIEQKDDYDNTSQDSQHKKLDERSTSGEKKGIWNWKPIRALSHIGMHKVSCLFSIEVVTAQGLPASMNGLRLSVCVRKKETKDGAVQTMPARVSQGAADFEETLFVKCHLYCNNGNEKHLKFEPRPFFIYIFAVDVKELDFGKSYVDLSQLIQESIEKNHEGERVRQWNTSFNLSGKAKGGELVLKLGFQIMEKEGGIGIYSRVEDKKSGKLRNFTSSFARKQSKTSFSVPSPKLSSRKDAWTPSQSRQMADIQGIDDLNLDEPAPVEASAPPVQKPKEPEPKTEELDLPDFEVIDKGVEFQEKEEDAEKESIKSVEERSVSSEVVKEIVHDQLHLARLSELDSIAQQIKALESLMGEEKNFNKEEETASQRLDEDEETVTKEFLQLLEDEDTMEYKFNQADISHLQLEGTDEDSTDAESKVYLPDLGKNLGCVVQTRDGGYLVSMNPLDTAVSRKETPKMAMQLSKPLVTSQSLSGFELFQKMAALGIDELNSQLLGLMPMDELIGKTAEQVAFEGIASAIIQGRNKEGASSTAARTFAAVKSMATAISSGRKERISTGIWNVNEKPLTAEEVLAFSIQKIEHMAIEALKIQAEMAEEEAPFDVSPSYTNMVASSDKDNANPLASFIPLEDWNKWYGQATSETEQTGDSEIITLAMSVQLRDPIRRYEAVGGPIIVLIYAKLAEIEKNDEEKKFKITSLHIGGLNIRTKGKKNNWDNEKQRLTAMQWLVAHGLAKAGKKTKHVPSKAQDQLWSISSRLMADMWLKSMRNPDVKFAK